jgi:hypothetical protein
MRTQNPPPLKACRFDSDLGHHLLRNFFSAAVAAFTRLRVDGALLTSAGTARQESPPFT